MTQAPRGIDVRAAIMDQPTLLALTLTRPWPWAILHCPRDPKRIENREWAPPPSLIGRFIALHAGKGFDEDSAEDIAEWEPTAPLSPSDHPAGAIVGVMRVAGWVSGSHGILNDWRPRSGSKAVSAEVAESATRSRWFFGSYGWVLTHVLALPEPIPARGMQKLWSVETPQRSALLEQLARVQP